MLFLVVSCLFFSKGLGGSSSTQIDRAALIPATGSSAANGRRVKLTYKI